LSTGKLPDYGLKQKILYIDKTSAANLKNYGDVYLQEGNISDAIDFYQKADYNEGLQKLKQIAIDNGDVMNYQKAIKALHEEPKPADWETIGKKAIDLKKYFFARHALEKANNADLLDSLKKIMEAEENLKNQ
jgi:hypothetical protein